MEKITISSKIDSKFEFEMTAQGIDLKDGKVFFQIKKSDDIFYDVKCQHENGDRWSVTVPKGLIKNGSYNFKLCVIVEDFYFEPVEGQLNVISAQVIQVSGIDQNKKEKDDKAKDKTVKEEIIIEETKDDEKIIESDNEKQIVEKDEKDDDKVSEDNEIVEELKDDEETVKDDKEIEKETEDNKEETEDDANKRIKEYLNKINTEPLFTVDLEPTPTVTVDETKLPHHSSKFFEEIDKMHDINERRRLNKKIRESIKKTKKED